MSTDLHDHDLEARLRAVLAERASSITGPPPARPEASAPRMPTTAVDGRPRRRSRWVAAAAVTVALVGTGAVLAVRSPGAPAQRVRSVEPPPGAGHAVPELPSSVDLALVTPLHTGDGDEVAVARAYLAERFAYRGDIEVEPGDQLEGRLGGTPPQPGLVAQIEGALTFAAAPSPVDGVTALAFELPVAQADHPIAGRTYLRRDGGRWALVAVATDGLSTAGTTRADGRLRTVVRGARSDPNLATGVSVAVRLLDSTLVSAGRGGGNGVRGDGPVDEVPVVVSARAMRNRTLGLTEYVSDPPTRSAAIWSGSRSDAVRRRDPDAAARQFARSTTQPLGVVASEAVTPPAGLAQAGVGLTLAGGLHVDLALARTSTGWVVLGVRDDTGLAGSEETGEVGEGRDRMRTFRYRVPATTTDAVLTSVSAGQWTTVPVEDLDAAAGSATVEVRADLDVTATLLVGRDASGAVVTVQGSAWD